MEGGLDSAVPPDSGTLRRGCAPPEGWGRPGGGSEQGPMRAPSLLASPRVGLTGRGMATAPRTPPPPPMPCSLASHGHHPPPLPLPWPLWAPGAPVPAPAWCSLNTDPAVPSVPGGGVHSWGLWAPLLLLACLASSAAGVWAVKEAIFSLCYPVTILPLFRPVLGTALPESISLSVPARGSRPKPAKDEEPPWSGWASAWW